MTDLSGLLERVKIVLKPFAQFADRFGETAREDSWVLTRNPSGKGNLTMGDIRSARALHRELVALIANPDLARVKI